MTTRVAGPPGDSEPVAGLQAAIAAKDAPAVVSALLAFRAEIPHGYRPAESAVHTMLRGLPEPLREAALGEVMDCGAGRPAAAADLVRLAGVLALVADRDYVRRRELLADLVLCALHPESLRAPVREALLADAAAQDAGLYWPPRGSESACAALAGRINDADRRSLARWVMAFGKALWIVDVSLTRSQYDSLGGSLARRRLNWAAEETAELLRAARHGHCIAHPEAELIDGLQENELRFALPAAEQLSATDLRTLLPELRTIVDDLDAGRLGVCAHRQAKTAPRRFHALLGRAGQLPALSLPPDFFGESDGFAARAGAELADVLADPAAVALLRHCTTVNSVRATATWQRACRELAAGYQQATDTLERILRLVLATKVERSDGYFFGHVFLTPENAVFVRGAVWAYATLVGIDAAALLGEVAAHCGHKDLMLPGSMVDGPVANSAVAALGSLEGTAALDALRRIRGMAEHRTFQKSVAAALDAAALRSGLSREQIIERGVPDHGLDGSGRYVLQLGTCATASIVVDADGSAGIEYTNAGAAVRSLPAALRDTYATEVKELKARLKEVQGTLRSERERIEAALATDRTWPAQDWATYYLAHPMVAAHARRLLWEASSSPDGDGLWIAGLPERVGSEASSTRWQLRSHDGTAHEIPTDAVVRLWHPVRATVADIEAWRAQLTDTAYRQPFKQAFRELYLLTPAEETTATYSNRFAGHILRYGQVKALTAARGWTGLSLGDWSAGISGEAVHEFPGSSWRARLFLETASTGPTGVAELCATDQVRFERRVGRTWQAAALVEVPPTMLSEALRDVDLFVGVASIGADPQWTDRGETRHAGYWHEVSFGPVSESAGVRRATLARLLPRTRIADRVEIGDRFLRVRGELRTYKIHLGSGNVLMEPDDAYLCIVDARSKDAKRLFLPFEENGGVLSLIVSKAFLLADDRTITDVSILRQIDRR